MEIYLVGGAVRDQLLGLPVKDRDWVVVGATPEMLLSQGYQQVGKDFPVFLNPESHEEYALARTERKSGKGYTGFICDFSDEITLEQDLIRRDLTINAIAQDKDGKLHDPYHGVEDIHQRILRHISPAFPHPDFPFPDPFAESSKHILPNPMPALPSSRLSCSTVRSANFPCHCQSLPN